VQEAVATTPPIITLADVVARTLDGGTAFEAALDACLDGFCDADPDDRQALIDGEPTTTGDARRDAFLAACAEHLAWTWGLDRPGWTEAAGRCGGGIEGAAGGAAMTDDSPYAFARRGLSVPREPLLGHRRPPEPDGFLLTRLGAPPGRPSLRVHAREGGYGGGAPDAYASILVARPRGGGIGRDYALVSVLPPVRHLLGMTLTNVESTAVAAFVERHRAALFEHWRGGDSFGLLRCIDTAERRRRRRHAGR
jgi:hypothetical protein